MRGLSQIEHLTSGLTRVQKERLDKIKKNVRIALARQYGNDLNEMMTSVLVSEVICHPTVLMAVEGISDAMPSSRDQWDSLAADVVSENEFAKLNIASNREARLSELRHAEAAKLSPQRRLNLARAGELDAYLDKRVRDLLGVN